MWVTSAEPLGRALALGLATDGWQIAVCDAGSDAVSRLVAELEDVTTAYGIPAAVTSSEVAEEHVRMIEDTLGPIEALVNAASFSVDSDAVDIDEEDWRRAVDTNVICCFLASQSAARRMVERGRGRIVSFSSDATERGVAGTTSRACTEGSVLSMTRVFAVELATRGVRVNAVGLGPGGPDGAESRIPLGRLARPEDCIPIVRFLLSPDSDWITGATIHADGGANAAALVVQAGG